MKKVKLIPPDLKQCQAEIPNGCTAFSLGGVPAMKRCSRKPTCIVTEKNPGPDGQCGSMSLCDDCFLVLRTTLSVPEVDFVPIPRRKL